MIQPSQLGIFVLCVHYRCTQWLWNSVEEYMSATLVILIIILFLGQRFRLFDIYEGLSHITFLGTIEEGLFHQIFANSEYYP